MSNFFEYKNIQVNYSSIGKGSVIVLLHGFLENSSMWKGLLPLLSKKNRIITIDLLGHGKTENLSYIHTMEEQANMVNYVLTKLKLRKFNFVGHSMGGYVALAFAVLFPEKTKSICLLNSTAYSASNEKKASRDRAIKAVKQNYKTFIRISIPMLFSEQNRDQLKPKIDRVTSEALKTSKQGVIAALEGMKIRHDYTSLLSNDKIKIVLILGEKDTVLDFNTHIQQIKNTNIKWHKIKHGHMSHIEAKEDVVSIIKKFR